MRTYALTLLFLLAVVPARMIAQSEEGTFDALLMRAQEAQQQSDFVTAAAAYRRATALHGDIPELWANRGLMEHQSGQIPAAIESFERALQLKPALFVPNLFLGIDLLEQKHPQQAIPYLSKAQSLDRTDPQAPLALARAHAALQQHREAIAAYTNVLQLNAENFDALYGFGLMSLKQVEDDSRVLTAEYSPSPFLNLLAAESFSQENKAVEAAAFFDKALIAPGAPACASTEYGFLLLHQHKRDQAALRFQAEPEDGRSCPIGALGAARMHLERAEYPAAWQSITSVWKADEAFVRVNVDLLRDGWTPEQSVRIQASLHESSSPQVAPAASESSMREFLLKSFEEPVAGSGPATLEASLWDQQQTACRPLQRPASTHTTASEDVSYAAMCSFFAGDYAGAASYSRTLQASERTRAVGLFWEIKADQKMAIAALNRAEAHAPNTSQAHVVLGDIFRQQQHFEDARREYNRALVLSPQDPGALLGLAVAEFMDGHADRALEPARSLLKTDPQDTQVNLLIGESLVSLNRYAEAEPFLHASLRAPAELLPRVHALLGRCYKEDGNDPKAIEEYKAALHGDKDGSVHYQLALMLRRNGDASEAASLMEISKRLHEEQRQRSFVAMDEIQHNHNDETGLK